MNVFSKMYKYKTVQRIENAGRSLYGDILKLIFNGGESMLVASSKEIEYYSMSGEHRKDFGRNIKTGDIMILQPDDVPHNINW